MYAPPAGNAVAFNFTVASYAAPAGNAVAFKFPADTTLSDRRRMSLM